MTSSKIDVVISISDLNQIKINELPVVPLPNRPGLIPSTSIR